MGSSNGMRVRTTQALGASSQPAAKQAARAIGTRRAHEKKGAMGALRLEAWTSAWTATAAGTATAARATGARAGGTRTARPTSTGTVATAGTRGAGTRVARTLAIRIEARVGVIRRKTRGAIRVAVRPWRTLALAAGSARTALLAAEAALLARSTAARTPAAARARALAGVGLACARAIGIAMSARAGLHAVGHVPGAERCGILRARL